MAKKSEETAIPHKVLSPITYGEIDGKGARKDVDYAPGDSIELTPAEAAPFVACGVIEAPAAKSEKAKG